MKKRKKIKYTTKNVKILLTAIEAEKKEIEKNVDRNSKSSN